MPSAAEHLHAAIAAAGGAIPFRQFMAQALYGPDGFYSGTGRAGRRGDFITSPEVGPLFGTVLAGALDGWWDDLGRPDRFTVVDAGAGPGTLARSVLAAEPRCAPAMEFVAVEVSDSQRASHPDGVTSLARLPPGPFTGVIVANELLDNLPFQLFVWDSGWRESFVASEGERFVEVLVSPPGELPDCLPSAAPHGARAPVQDDAAAWLVDARSRLHAGSVIVVDYCVPTTASLANRPWREWLRTYRAHERGGHYLADPGSQDITAEVALDQLIATSGEPTWVRSQAQALELWGIGDLVAEGKRVWAEQAARPGLEAMKMRSRVSESEALLDPTGLGAFTIAAWPPDVQPERGGVGDVVQSRG